MPDDRHTAGQIAGTGIGLATVRQIVQQHASRIAVASGEG
jgi:signal transduction histidine kinase